MSEERKKKSNSDALKETEHGYYITSEFDNISGEFLLVVSLKLMGICSDRNDTQNAGYVCTQGTLTHTLPNSILQGHIRKFPD